MGERLSRFVSGPWRGLGTVQGGGASCRFLLMPRWLWFAPLVLLLVLSGVWAFRLGWIAATISETDVIAAFAARYVAAQGSPAQATDCSAQPGQARGVWIVVTCGAPGAGSVVYAVDRLGREVLHPERKVKATRPET